ncbi:YtxH domain-containing protein [Gephyromycinifex aptenodytis]|uniref:YtxH domain-containing protein n=1 Tax=Gephyromycinifex aptenodytis TaxID=2716227 RepID=UPI00144662CB|nr:YtxH domain-containing protein [Gephyromycinifex aptenodytis]
MYRLTFLAGAAVGYVLGTRAGRGRYEEMKQQADALWHDPRVQEKVSTASQTVKEKAPDVSAKLAEVAGQATAAAKEKVSGDSKDDMLIGSESGSDYVPHETKFQS